MTTTLLCLPLSKAGLTGKYTRTDVKVNGG